MGEARVPAQGTDIRRVDSGRGRLCWCVVCRPQLSRSAEKPNERFLFLYPVELGSESGFCFFFFVLSKLVILSDLNMHALVILQVGSQS